MTLRPISAAEAETLLTPLRRFPRIAIAVSGGPDSLALLYLAARWGHGRDPKPAITALTVDHRLRPSSRAEAEMVAERAAPFGVPHAILVWSHGELGDRALQSQAREARYGLLAAYCHAHDIPALATAHQLDDQAETLLMRLKRGSGLDGLAGIPEESVFAGIVLLRPLLETRKERLVATLQAAGIGFASDPSNVDPRFERTALKTDVKALAALGLTPEAMARSARRLRRARAALVEAAAHFLESHASLDEAGYAMIEREALLSAPEEIAIRALSRVLGAVGGRPEPIRLSKVEVLLASLIGAPRKAHTLAGCRIEPVGGAFGVFREVRGGGLPELALRPGERALWDNRFSVELGRKAPGPVLVRALGAATAAPAASSQELAALPRRARLTLPAGFAGGEILLPHLGSPQEGPDRAFRARFVNRGAFPPEFRRLTR